MPDVEGPSGAPSRYRHQFQHQSLLTSGQLAQYVQLPELETAGFTISTVARFDVVRPTPRPPAFTLGTIATGTRHLEGDDDAEANPFAPRYGVALHDLIRHVFTAGVTGAGKTTTIRRLLSQADTASGGQVPFLILEPAKTEYRSLLTDPQFAGRLRVFTLGDETTAPLRINPLQVLPGTSISAHLDLLKSLFVASFGMWSPLPQILERALHELYTRAGWDITRDRNPRVPDGGRPATAFPTLGALHAQVEQVIDSLGYTGEVVANMRAALSTRLNALCIGGKGRLLNTTGTIDAAELFEHPTVLELEAMGDDEDKAFVMGLILIQLAAYRRAHPGTTLRHLLVVEEAHRLLANVPAADPALQGNPRGKAVETFTNLLAEVRSLGQGIIISDQAPTRLAPDLIKNTDLKIAHRIVAADDRAALGAAMGMSEAQQRDLATLTNGVAAVFSEGDDAPVRVRIPRPASQPTRVSTGEVRHAMAPVLGRLMPRAVEERSGLATQAAQTLAANPAVTTALTQLVLSTIDDAGAPDRLWPDVGELIHARRPATVPADELLTELIDMYAGSLADRWGAEYAWTFPDTSRFSTAVTQLFTATATQLDIEASTRTFQDCARQLLRRDEDPYPRCATFCGPGPGPCHFRAASADAHTNRQLAAAWREASDTEVESGELSRRYAVAGQAADTVLEVIDPNPTAGVRLRHARAAACYLQVGLTRHSGLSAAAIHRTLHTITITTPTEADDG